MDGVKADDGPPALLGEVARYVDGDGDHVAVVEYLVGHDVAIYDGDAWQEHADAEMHAHVFYVGWVTERARAERADSDALQLLAERSDAVRLLGGAPDADVLALAKEVVARAERAEKIADAYRRHRDGIRSLNTYEDKLGEGYRQVMSDLTVAYEDLRALGVEP